MSRKALGFALLALAAFNQRMISGSRQLGRMTMCI